MACRERRGEGGGPMSAAETRALEGGGDATVRSGRAGRSRRGLGAVPV